jgi:hypothetical protein
MTLTTYEELKLLASSDNTNELTRRLARECFGNREAQPVMWVHERKLSTDVAITKDAAVAAAWESEGLSVKPLYTAPPAPTVPDELSRSLSSIAREYQTTPLNALFIVVGWNACRAAMLAQPVSSGYKSNSPVIPDGWKLVPIDATRAMIDAAQKVEEEGYDAMHKAMLAAAPEGGNDA